MLRMVLIGVLRVLTDQLPAAGQAPVNPNVPMQFHNPPAAGQIVQPIYILSCHGKSVLRPLEFDKREVPRVWLCRGNHAPPPLIPFPNEIRIPAEGARRCQFFWTKASPQSSGAAKGRDAAFGGDPRPRERDHRCCLQQPFSRLIQITLLQRLKVLLAKRNRGVGGGSNSKEELRLGTSQLLQSIADRLQAGATARSVYGEPIQAGERTIIPVARVSFGFGGGSGRNSGGEEADKPDAGGGGGGGMRAIPVGVLEVSPDGTSFIPILQRRAIAAAFLAGIVAGSVAARIRR